MTVEQRHGVDPGVGAVSRVDAQAKLAGIDVGEQPLHLVLELHVGADVGVDRRPQSEAVRGLGGAPDPVEERCPACFVEPGGRIRPARGRAPIIRQGVDHDQRARLARAEQLAGLPHCAVDRGVFGPRRERCHHEPGGQCQPALAKPFGQLGGRLRKVAERAELCAGVAGAGDFVEDPLPRRILQRHRGLDPPGRGSARDAQAHAVTPSTRTHCRSRADTRAASMTRWTFKPSANPGAAGRSSRMAATSSPAISVYAAS